MVKIQANPRSKASFRVEAVLMSAIWVLNLYQIAFYFRSMGLLAGLTAGMIFFVSPVEVSRAVFGYREYQG